MSSNLEIYAAEHQLDATQLGAVLLHAMEAKVIPEVDLTCRQLELGDIGNCNSIGNIIDKIRDQRKVIMSEFYDEECGEETVWPDEPVDTCPRPNDCPYKVSQRTDDTKKEISRLSKVAALREILKWLGVEDK